MFVYDEQSGCYPNVAPNDNETLGLVNLLLVRFVINCKKFKSLDKSFKFLRLNFSSS